MNATAPRPIRAINAPYPGDLVGVGTGVGGRVGTVKFLAGLSRLYRDNQLDLRGEAEDLAAPDVFRFFKDRLYRKEWVAYQKPPFAGPEAVYRYLGRYTHRIAISNHRLLAFDAEGVRFRTKYGKTAVLKPQEFVRRFLLHVLPRGFVRIRHFGLLAPCQTKHKLEAARQLLAPETAPIRFAEVAAPSEPATPCDQLVTAPPEGFPCPRCGSGSLRRQHLPEQRRPPPWALAS